MSSLTDYAICIKKLKTPYPEECLLNFLSQLVEKFSLYTDFKKTTFDGRKKVTISRGRKRLRFLELANLFHGLTKYHPEDSKIFALFDRQLLLFSKNFQDKENRYLVVSEKSIRDLPDRNNWIITLSPTIDSVAKVIEIVTDDLFDDNRVRKIYLLDHQYWDLDLPKLKIDVQSSNPNIYSLVERLKRKLDNVEQSCRDTPYFYNYKCINVSQGWESEELRKRLDDRSLDTLFDGPNHYKYFGTPDVTIDHVLYEKMRNVIFDTGRDKLREKPFNLPIGTFTDLLFTQNETLEFALEIFLGRETLRKRDYVWGVSPQGGEVIFVMKEKFYKGYPSTLFKNLRSKTIKTAADGNLKRQAQLFRFTKPKIVKKCLEDYASWCSISLEIPDVSIYDVEAVLIPSFLFKSDFMWKDRSIRSILADANNLLYIDYHPNPFKGRVYPYGDDLPYLYINRTEVGLIYQSLFRELKKEYIFDEFDRHRAELLGLKNPHEETALAVDYLSFVEIEMQYMYILLYKNFVQYSVLGKAIESFLD